jgi:hypothetical protein
MKTGVAHLPLHGGRAPRWLFNKMVSLSGAILELMVMTWGTEKVLACLADPFWFQALGCILGFDWHSSGLTTTTCGAIKEAVRQRGNALGLFVAGGKGKTSLKTPGEIEQYCEKNGISEASGLVYTSRMVAKVDTSGIQDGYALYHHTFFFNREGSWAVVQQGMHSENRYARRYHWLKSHVTSFVDEPHSGIASPRKQEAILNLVAHQSAASRREMTQLACLGPDKLLREINCFDTLSLPRHHPVFAEKFHPERMQKTLTAAYEQSPDSFETLIGARGVGPKTLRALALLSELMFGTSPSFREPELFSFAHGGKDGHPYPVDLPAYQASIEMLETCLRQAKIGRTDKIKSFKALSLFMKRNPEPSDESQ